MEERLRRRRIVADELFHELEVDRKCDEMLLHAVVQLALDAAAVAVGRENELAKLCAFSGLHSVSLDRDSSALAVWLMSSLGKRDVTTKGGRLPLNGRAQSTRRGAAFAASILVLAVTPFAATATAGPQRDADVRFATFNASLNRNAAGELVPDLSTPANAQAADVAEIIQRAGPDVLLINEFDFDRTQAAACSSETTCRCRQNGAAADRLPIPVHRAVEHGHPVRLRPRQQRRRIGGPGRRLRLRLLPRPVRHGRLLDVPDRRDDVRTFQIFLWKDMPGALLPDDPTTPAPADWYSPDELAVFRLSSKSHWDLPIQVGKKPVHFLVSHPTPPVFDGPEDRNGTRNHDEIRFWADYVTPGESGATSTTTRAGRRPEARASLRDRRRPERRPVRRRQHPRRDPAAARAPAVNTTLTPVEPGAVEQASSRAAHNLTPPGDPAFDTADFADTAPGQPARRLRPAGKNLKIVDGGVFWPLSTDPLFPAVGSSRSRARTTAWSGSTSPFRASSQQCVAAGA